jgi:DNA-binding CsgD family transcriptional regulator
MQPVQATRFIKQVAAMGMPPSDAIPLMMEALEHVVPSQNNPFSWTQADGMPTRVWLPEIAPHAFEAAFAETFADRGPDAPTIDKLTGGPRPFNNTADVHRMPRWKKSALKNELLHYYNAEQSCDFAVRDGGVLKASFSISRPEQAVPFTMRELRRVHALVPYFLHALNAPASAQSTCETSSALPDGTAAQLTAARDGTILGMGPGAEDLLFKLADVEWTEQRSVASTLARLPSKVTALFDRFDPLSNVPPTVDLKSRWGLFRVMVHPVKAVATSIPDMAIVTIQPLLPAAARHMRMLCRYAMTPAERRVALLMTEQCSGDVIAARAGLTLNSYRQIAKRIYSVLEVGGRDAVRQFLMSH